MDSPVMLLRVAGFVHASNSDKAQNSKLKLIGCFFIDFTIYKFIAHRRDPDVTVPLTGSQKSS